MAASDLKRAGKPGSDLAHLLMLFDEQLEVRAWRELLAGLDAAGDASGIVKVTIWNRSAAYRREYTLGRWSSSTRRAAEVTAVKHG